MMDTNNKKSFSKNLFQTYLTVRNVDTLAALLCFFILSYSFYLQHVLNILPCSLCIIERLILMIVGLFFFIGACMRTTTHSAWNRYYHYFGILLCVIGLLVSTRHVWLQYYAAPSLSSSGCAPGLRYLLETLPLTEAMKLVFQGNSDCAQIDWTINGLSLSVWMVILFVFFMVVCFAQAIRQK